MARLFVCSDCDREFWTSEMYPMCYKCGKQCNTREEDNDGLLVLFVKSVAAFTTASSFAVHPLFPIPVGIAWYKIIKLLES